MNRSSGNASKKKKIDSEAANMTKPNRKSFHILSESSSISSNRNSSPQSEEDVVNVAETHPSQQGISNGPNEERELLMKKLQCQMKDLRHKLKILEESVESKDYSLGTIAREKDRAIGEIRRLERSNKQLKQQLNEERNHYIEEKEKFCEEMTRYKRKLQEVKTADEQKKKESKWTPILPISQQSLRWHFNKEKGDFADITKGGAHLKSSKSQKLTGTKDKVNPLGCYSCSDSQIQKTWSLESLHLYDGNDQALQMAALKTENAKLRSIICERDERNYELCLRFLRMKHCKNDIRTRFQDLENEYLQVIMNLMEKIDEARQEFNFIIDQKFKKPLHTTNAMYLRLIEKNSKMTFENASLRLENQCLKNELKKHLIAVPELDRKIDETSGLVDQDPTAISDENKSLSKLNRTKKNVNFKEIRTIYQRNKAFKNSDTDSNYMSKTSTTVPSNGSLTDPKSNESIVENVGGDRPKTKQNKHETPFQSGSLPDDILNKIFKRVDTSSCQTLESFKLKDVQPIADNAGSDEELQSSKKSIRPWETSDKKNKIKEDAVLLRNAEREATSNGNTIVKTSFLTNSSTPCDSKESVSFDPMNSINAVPYTPSEFVKLSNKMGGMNSLEKEAYLNIKRSEKALPPRPLRSLSKYSDRDADDGIRLFDYSSPLQTNWLKRREKAALMNAGRKTLVKDSCGLQEKMEMSYQELPWKADSNMQRASGLINEDESSLRMTQPVEDAQKNKDIENDDKEIKVEGAKTYRIDQVSSINFKNRKCDKLEGIHNMRGTQRSRRSEGSKRFSQRLISTSPEQLRNILTESQLEACYKMTPVIVGHATTEINQEFPSVERNSDIVLQLVIPASSVEKSCQSFINSESAARKTLEKETSVSGLNPVASNKFSEIPAEGCPSDIRIPLSNLPTSTSTMDVVDLEALNDKSNIILRTLSAPGLLESSWLDPYTVCEMRDCSTNT